MIRFDYDLIFDPELLLAGSISLDDLDDGMTFKDGSFSTMASFADFDGSLGTSSYSSLG